MNGMLICIGCGCTDQHACAGGCSWIVRDAGVGVCSSCSQALPRWDQGARAAAWLPAPELLRQGVTVNLGGQLELYAPGTGQPPGQYFVVDFGRGTLRIVDEQGLPANAHGDAVSIDSAVDWEATAKAKSAEARRYGAGRERTADEIRADQLKLERRRARDKAAKRSRQAARRRP